MELVWWEEYDEEEREEYRGLEEMELTALITQECVEVIEHTEYIEYEKPMHDVVIKRSQYNGKIKIENVPPSEFLISREAKNIASLRLVLLRS